MSTIQKVALAGATGNLGPAILEALLDAGFEVTVLTRGSSNHTIPAQAKVAKVDYADAQSLAHALEGQDALVSNVSSRFPDVQISLIDAALAEGIKRFIPSEFGSDIENEKTAALPVFKGKVNVEEYLRQKCTKGAAMTYTLIFNSAFLDWGLSKLIMDIPNKSVNIFDGGDRPFTANNLTEVAKGTVGVLQHPADTANRAVRINSAVVTQNQLLGLAKKYVGEDGWQVKHSDTAELVKQGNANIADPSAMLGFLVRSIFGEGYGGDFSGRDDNELLGIPQLSETELEETVKGVVNATAAK